MCREGDWRRMEHPKLRMSCQGKGLGTQFWLDVCNVKVPGELRVKDEA